MAGITRIRRTGWIHLISIPKAWASSYTAGGWALVRTAFNGGRPPPRWHGKLENDSHTNSHYGAFTLATCCRTSWATSLVWCILLRMFIFYTCNVHNQATSGFVKNKLRPILTYLFPVTVQRIIVGAFLILRITTTPVLRRFQEITWTNRCRINYPIKRRNYKSWWRLKLSYCGSIFFAEYTRITSRNTEVGPICVQLYFRVCLAKDTI